MLRFLDRKRSVFRVDSNDNIVADVLCIRCGQNLRGRTVHDACPSCLHPASDSVYGDYLIHVDRANVLRLIESSTAVVLGAALLGGMVLVATLVHTVGALSFDDGVERAFDMLFTGAVIAPLVAFVGITLLTRRHGFDYFRARYGNAAFLRRTAVVALILVSAAVAALYFAGPPTRVLVLASWATIPPAWLLRGLQLLALRLPNRRLAHSALLACVGVCVMGAFAAGVHLLRLLPADDERLSATLLVLTFFCCLGGIGMGVAILRLLMQARRSLAAVVGMA